MTGDFMKKFTALVFVSLLITGCAPKIGSEEWCKDMKKKPKGDWTMTEATDYTKHCILPKSKD